MADFDESAKPNLDLVRIKELITKTGIKQLIEETVEKFNKLPGTTLMLGVTPKGLFVGVRLEGEDSFDYQAFVLDLTLSPAEIMEKKVETVIPAFEVLLQRDGGSRFFPREVNAIERIGEKNPTLLNFYKVTGGFSWPSELRRTPPSVGKETLYPLDQIK